MKILLSILLVCMAAATLAAPKSAAPCDTENCVLPNCRCSGTDIPGNLKPEEIPQLVFLTFDDAVNAANFKYYEEFFNRKNPDGCPIGATFFTSHEYTDYSKVHELHARGHEIALHSISHTPSIDYWKDLAVNIQVDEFGGERELISKFAQIPADDITGMRLPLLQLSGDNSFVAAKELKLTYDCSWPTRQNIEPGLWPYTLDYLSTQDCPISNCPSGSVPGLWVNPMVMWYDDLNTTCSMVDACTNIPEDKEGILKFMVRNFESHYNSNKSPFGFYMHAAWFEKIENSFAAYVGFLDYLMEKKDVYIVTISRGLEWVRNPNKLDNLKETWETCQKTSPPTCKGQSCKLMKGTEERYMMSCAPCPAVFPWLGNPLGAKK